MPNDFVNRRRSKRCSARILFPVAALLSWSIFTHLGADQSAIPQLPPLRDLNPIVTAGSWVYQGQDGEVVYLDRTESIGGTTNLTMRVISAMGVSQVTHAVILTDSPFTLVRAGGIFSKSNNSVLQTVKRDSKSGVWSHGLLQQNGPKTSVDEVRSLPRPPTTELSLLIALCAVAWEFGYEFSVPILWYLDRDVVETRTFMRAHVLCTGRETVEIASGRRSCWRVVVESQGGESVLRRVCWFSAKAPYELVRLEVTGQTVLDLVKSSFWIRADEEPSGKRVSEQSSD